ncbi:MAG: SPOR domain-containing protein [Rhizobium sp.]|nr:SPOR domain-containing protein [Rhizobium sp.]
MVQKQAANSIRSQGDGFADDDPLAELARIVGFDQPLKREPVVSLPQAPDMGSAEFNLEDELMREFEGYEAAPAPSSYAPPLSVPEPVVARPTSAIVESVPAANYREEPRFEPEPMIAYPAQQVAYEPEPVEYPEPVSYVEDPYVSDMDLSAADTPELYRVDEAPVDARVEPEISFDLADELEFAVADADVRPVAPVASPQPAQVETPRLRLPLANFSAQPVRRPEPQLAVEPPREAPAFDLSDFEAPSAPSISVAQEPVALDFGKASFDWAAGPVEPIPASAPAQQRIDTVVAPAVSAGFDDFAVEAEPRPAQPVVAPVPLPAAAAMDRNESEFSFDFLNELALDEDVDVAPQAAEPVVQRVAPVIADEEFDPFQDQEFDLQLDDIELDLSELDVAPQKPAPLPAPVVSAAAFAAAAAAPAAVPGRVEPAVTTAPSYAAAPTVPAYVAAPTVSASAFAAAVARPAVENPVVAPVPSSAPMRPAMPVDDSFAFDPSEISEQDDLLETLSGMDVPDVPVADARPAQAPQPDYDIDIDAELATLFEEPVVPAARQPNPAAVSRVAAAVAPAAAAGARAPAAPLDEFDAFEKALEEDFRTSMNSSGALEPESRGHITISGEGQGFRFRHIKPYLMAGTAVIVLLAGAGGLYAWLGSGAIGTLSGGEPQVIAADKSPVKIVPEDPGGKSVPNQDKAVYDRVAGNGVEDPKQTSLISSQEQPVDVVQRTLIPETLPMDGGSEALATPVGETEDPRLLPDGQPPQAAAEDPATITPRKVRTMIVRPDGTLVAQEVPAEPTPAALQTASAPSSQSPADAPVLAPPSVPNANAGDTVRTVDTRVVTPDGTTDAAASATAPAATTTAAAELAAATPVTAETVAAPADAAASRAPVPTTRPADQPVNVVGTVTDQGNLRPAAPAPAQPAAQAEVAAASPAAATPAPATAAPAGSFGVQIASLPSEADAQKSYRNLSTKFAGVLGGKPWEIRQADIPGKGTFYRVRVVAGSKDDAVALCEQYRAAGGSCLVSR